MNKKELDFTKVANKVSIIAILANLILAIFKLLAGIIAHSSAMISDAIHSASDVFSTIVVIIGIKLSGKEADKDHPYGHERIECVAAILLSIVLFATGLGIFINALKTIINGEYNNMEVPGLLALIAAIVSIIIKELMYWYTRYYAKQINSSALMADAWHHRSDSLSSIGALIGIIFARLGFPIMDSVASIIIFIFIIKASIEIFNDAVSKVVDHSCDEEIENEIYNYVINHKDVIDIDLLRTRLFGNKIYVDLEIQLKGDLTLNKAHKIAEEIHDDIEDKFSDVKHVMVHVNPSNKKK
ncbi:MAG: cation transporter [Bacilli bacterium]|nr:cation transporter [Bacilli bacterium]